MQYNDEALPTLSSIEEMAKTYSSSLKQKGFVFVNLEEEGKKPTTLFQPSYFIPLSSLNLTVSTQAFSEHLTVILLMSLTY